MPKLLFDPRPGGAGELFDLKTDCSEATADPARGRPEKSILSEYSSCGGENFLTAVHESDFREACPKMQVVTYLHRRFHEYATAVSLLAPFSNHDQQERD